MVCNVGRGGVGGGKPGQQTMEERTMARFKGKKVLVTGGATGIGQAIAVRFAAEGADVAINWFTQADEAKQTEASVQEACQKVREQGCQDLLVQANVADEAEVQQMFQKVLEKWGRLDILINNAGIQIAEASESLTADNFDKVVAVNLRGAYLCSREALKHFLTRDGGGIILNNSSVHEIIPKPGFLGYAVSKGGMRSMTRTLALEYAGRDIRVNAVAPGAIVTPINRAWIDDPQKRGEVERNIPQGRAGTAEEVAGVFAFLASDDAAYITGQTIFVDGGLTLYPQFEEDWTSDV
ncbi:MAG: glucose 1-dehydrogenase [Phycisphaeraceae bacterium]